MSNKNKKLQFAANVAKQTVPEVINANNSEVINPEASEAKQPTKIELRKAFNSEHATERTEKAKKLLAVRVVLNSMRVAKQRKANKVLNASVSTRKAPRYDNIYTGVTNLHMLAALLTVNKASDEKIASCFIEAYAIKKQFDLSFITSRINVYLTHAKTLAIIDKLNKANTVNSEVKTA